MNERVGRRSLAVARAAVVVAVLISGHAALASPREQSAAPPAGAVRGESLSVRVTRVVDGDTVHATVTGQGRKGVRIRLDGIDCPEPGQAFSQTARNFTRQFAFDQVVALRVVDVDRYGRLVGRLTRNGQDLSLELVKAGLAWHYTQYSSDKLLAAAERDARASRRGLWADANATPPWVARRPSSIPQERRASPGAAARFVGNVRSGVYHADTCKNALCKNCTREFKSEAEAQSAGFRAAGDCLRKSE